MSDALAKIQASGAVTRVERTVEVCLAQGVPKEVQRLANELAALQVEAYRKPSDDTEPSDAPSRKMAQGHDPRVEEKKAELNRLDAVMREATGSVTVANTITQGEWRRWADAHPARDDGRDAQGRPIMLPYDYVVASGYCNATDLLERLGDFVTEWDGEPLAAGQWEWLAEKAHPGDLKEIARTVVGIYEGEGTKALPKSWSDLFETETSEIS